MLNDRTLQLVECISNRKDSVGVVNLGPCMEHWAFDMMVGGLDLVNYQSKIWYYSGRPYFRWQ